MTAIDKIKTGVSVTVSLFGLITIFYSVIDLMVFLSWPNFYTQKVRTKSNGDEWLQISWSLFSNMFLLSLFILQHSLLALPIVKKAFVSTGFQTIERSSYTIATAFVLQVLMKNWREIQEVTLWEFRLTRFSWWFFVAVHVFAWTIIYVGNICMDVTELIGVKQVYYSIKGFAEPNSFKSIPLKRLHSHMRHPGFLAFLILFWCIPVLR